jgi:REP element-mobilizing transposase RayT
MPVKELIIPLEPGKYYHVYNRGNNKEKLFFDSSDYIVFLKNYNKYLGSSVVTYAYCLLPNHFHFLIRINANEDSSNVSNQFRKLFIAHAKRINTYRGRKGCLLTRNFRRIEICDQQYLLHVVRYIHYNPVKHGYTDSISNYYYSTFNVYIYQSNPYIEYNEVLSWFNGIKNFLEFHGQSESDVNFMVLPFDE